MDAQIHYLEKEAYFSVLRAFKAQSDALTWDKEGLITELRKELRVLDDEHRELLGRVNNDDSIRSIREWRHGGGHQASVLSTSHSGPDTMPSPSMSASLRKKHKASLSHQVPGLSTMKSNQYPTGSAGRRQNPLYGRKLWTRWPDDNNYYEAIITNYNPADGRYELVYDMNTPNATYEWVDLKEIAPEDIQWEGEDPGICYRGGQRGQGRGVRRSSGHGVSGSTPVARGRGSAKGQTRNEYHQLQNGVGNNFSDEMLSFETNRLVQEAERIFIANPPDPLEIAKMKKMLKEHEKALIEAIASLPDASDSESDGEQQFLHQQSMETE